jgi:hypothetical protein
VRRYVFRLSDRASRGFKGVVVIFATQPQEVWRKLVTDERAEQIRHSVMDNEVAQLAMEFDELVAAAAIGHDTPLLRQLFDDLAINQNHIPTFIGSHSFTMIARTQGSFGRWVDRSYHEVQQQGSQLEV